MKNPYFIFIVFAVIGLPFLIAGIFTGFSSFQKVTSWQTAEGVVTSIHSDNNIAVAFTHAGKSFEIQSTFGTDDMIEGQAVSVYFPSDQPEKAEVKSFISTWLFTLIFLFFGLTFGGVGFIGIRWRMLQSKAKNELFTEQRGKKLAGLPASVTLNRSYKVNNVNPYIITAFWIDPLTNVRHEFKSENIWYDPSGFITNNKIDVWVDEMNFKRYYVDITSLPADK